MGTVFSHLAHQCLTSSVPSEQNIALLLPHFGKILCTFYQKQKILNKTYHYPVSIILKKKESTIILMYYTRNVLKFCDPSAPKYQKTRCHNTDLCLDFLFFLKLEQQQKLSKVQGRPDVPSA